MVTGQKLWRRLIALTAVGCFLLCLVGCRETGINGSFSLPLAKEPRQLDPQVSDDAASVEVLMALFEGLTRLDEAGEIQPAAAQRWEITENGLCYTFTLREAVWSDGTPVTAQDFVYGIQRAADPATGSPLRERLSGIAGAEAVLAGTQAVQQLGVTAADAQTLVIRLQEPDNTFLRALSSPPFFPCQETFFQACKGHYGLERDYVLGNGPFTLKRWTHGSSLTLVRNDTYWEAGTVAPASVRYVIDNGSSRLSALTAGTVDVAPLSSKQEVTAAKATGMQVTVLNDTLYGLWFNCSLPVLNSAAVRTALRDAVEWSAVEADLTDGMQCATGYVVPDSVLADATVYRTAENAHRFATAADAAQRFKKALGGAECPQFTLLCTEEELVIARDIVQSWQKNLSLYFHLETVSADTRDARLKAGNYQLALGSLTPGGEAAADTLECFSSTARAGNYARFQSTGCDTQIAAARDGTRAQAEAAEAALLAQCPMVPIAFVSNYYGVSYCVEGLVIRPFNGGRHGAVFGYRSAKKTEE